MSEPKFTVVGQFARDVSFECPLPPFAKESENLNVQMDVGVGTRKIEGDDDIYETMVRLKVSAQNAQKKTCFLTEVEYAGVYKLEGFDAEQTDMVLHVDGAAIVYPFARQLAITLITDAGYKAPPVGAVNFHGLYVQSKEQKRASA